MQDSIELVFLQDFIEGTGRNNIFNDSELKLIAILGELVLEVRRLGLRTNSADDGMAPFEERFDDLDADEAVGACEEDGVRHDALGRDKRAH